MMTTQTDRAALIARLRECRYELIPYLLMRQAADMLEVDGKAVPQEPVAYAIFAENGNIRIWSTEQQHVKRIAQEQGLSLVKLFAAPQPQEPVAWKTDTSSGELRFTIGVQTFTIGYDADGEEELQWMEKQLIIALSKMAAPQPQRPRLSDEEIAHMWAYNPGWSAVDFARLIEKKVRGEA